jgi:two-component system, LytTR family, sensor kinase
MQEIQPIRRFELATVLLSAGILIAVQLSMNITHYHSLQVMDHSNYFAAINYTHWLNLIFPVIARAVLVLMGWYVFHYLAFPQLKAGIFTDKTFGYLALAIIFIATGVFIYYLFRTHLRVIINHNIINHISTYSQFRKMTLFSDTVGILIVVGMYELLMQGYYYIHRQLSREKEKIYRGISFFLLACIITFLTIFAIIIPLPSTLWQDPTSIFLFISGLVLLVFVLQAFIFRYLLPLIHTPRSPQFIRNLGIYLLIAFTGIYVLEACRSQFRGFSSQTMVLFFIMILASWVHAYIRSLFSREKRILQTQVSATSAELASLRSQINPHFLFNALNSLYATALKENSEKTADGIQKLGDMMHFLLQENNQDRIPLSKEIEYLQNYIHMQRLRTDESQGVEIRVNIQEPDQEMYIAPMMLNPFVENAFKHGISLLQPSWIYITLTLDATRLYFKVHNSLHTKRENDPEQDNSGVGLGNVKKRLELIYPSRHTLDIQQSDKDFFVSLTLVYTE